MTPPTVPITGDTHRLSARSWGVLLVLCCALFLDALDVSMTGVAALPPPSALNWA